MGLVYVKLNIIISNENEICMRLEIKKGINQNQIINGVGNLDQDSLSKALSLQEQQNSGANKVLIIEENEILNISALFELIKKFSIQQVLYIGSSLEETLHNCRSFLNINALINSKAFQDLSKKSILILSEEKDSLVKVSNLLVEKVHQTRLEINLDHIKHNFEFYKSLLEHKTKVMAVIKAFAYGSGSAEVARLLESAQVDYLAVAYSDEGVALRKEGISTPIMVMNPSLSDAHYLMKYDLEPEIYSAEQLKHYHQAYQNSDKRLRLHLMLNTGMNRLGFDESGISELIKTIRDLKNLQIRGISSHLAASDNQNEKEFTLKQFNSFTHLADLISSQLDEKPLYHVLNSGGITRYPEFQFDMVRLGIGLHGIEVNHKFHSKLKVPSTLKTIISQVREINAAETIGYGRVGKAEKNMKMAVIAIGYADGYSRAFSQGHGHVLVRGNLVPIVGNVCMDMAMIDITGIQAKEGDEVIVFGENLNIELLAKWSQTIPYEILTNVSSRVNRVFFQD